MKKRAIAPLAALLLCGGQALADLPGPFQQQPSPDGITTARQIRSTTIVLTDQPVNAQGPAPGTVSGPAPASPDAGTILLPPRPVLGSMDMAPAPPGVLIDDRNGAPFRFWVSAEYLLWWTKKDQAPPLITTGTTAGEGALLAPGTTVLLGGSDLSPGPFSGGRFSAGFWFSDCQNLGIEASYFFLGSRSNSATFNSASYPVLARPFFDLNNFTETVELVAFPGLGTGSVTVSNSSRLMSPEVNLVKSIYCCSDCNHAVHIDFLAGFRYLDLKEDLSITEMTRVDPGVPTFGGDFAIVSDDFATRNQFYGGQIGLDACCRRGPWVFDICGKLGFGDNHETINITGSQSVTTPAGVTTVTNNGGLLALPSNIGNYTKDVFSFVPEIGFNIGYQITDNLGIFMGYTFLYWTHVVRPGEQIDRVVDVTQIPNFPTTAAPTGQARPGVPFQQTDFWAQGLNFGVQFSW